MAIAIHFDKAKAQYYVDCLRAGKPIEGVRSPDEHLALAGACFFMAMSEGSELQQGVDWSRLPPEQEVDETHDNFIPDIHNAIEYYAQLTLLVVGDEYDDTFEPQHSAIVMMDRGKKTVVPIDGMREDDDEE